MKQEYIDPQVALFPHRMHFMQTKNPLPCRGKPRGRTVQRICYVLSAGEFRILAPWGATHYRVSILDYTEYAQCGLFSMTEF